MEHKSDQMIRYFSPNIDHHDRLPAIASDMDGVILRGLTAIGNSSAMMKKIFTPRENGAQIPFALLTNGGGFIEERKAEELNERLNLDALDPIYHLNRSHIIECHTPLSSKDIVDQYKDKYILICGYDEVLSAALSYGYHKAIHVDELAAVYPDAVPLDIPL